MDTPRESQDALATSALFESLSADTLARLTASSRVRLFAPGETILSNNSGLLEDIGVVVEGYADVYAVADSGIARPIAELGPNSWIGEFAAIDGRGGSTCIRARNAVLVVEVPRAHLAAVLRDNRDAANAFMETMARFVQTVDARMADCRAA